MTLKRGHIYTYVHCDYRSNLPCGKFSEKIHPCASQTLFTSDRRQDRRQSPWGIFHRKTLQRDCKLVFPTIAVVHLSLNIFCQMYLMLALFTSFKAINCHYTNTIQQYLAYIFVLAFEQKKLYVQSNNVIQA